MEADAWSAFAGGAPEAPGGLPACPPELDQLPERILTWAARLAGTQVALLWLVEEDHRLVVRKGIGRFSASVGRWLGKGDGLAGEAEMEQLRTGGELAGVAIDRAGRLAAAGPAPAGRAMGRGWLPGTAERYRALSEQIPAVLYSEVQGYYIDVTDQKLAEEALRQALDRERQAARELRALDEMKNTFLDAVSHELRTPLATVIDIALTLKRAGSSLAEEDTVDLVDRLVANAGKLDRLLSDLLDLDRLSKGLVAPQRTRTDVAALVGRIAREWRQRSGRRLDVTAEPVAPAAGAGPPRPGCRTTRPTAGTGGPGRAR